MSNVFLKYTMSSIDIFPRSSLGSKPTSVVSRVRSRGSLNTSGSFVRSPASLGPLPRSERGQSPHQQHYLPDKENRVDNDDVAEEDYQSLRRRRRNPHRQRRNRDFPAEDQFLTINDDRKMVSRQTPIYILDDPFRLSPLNTQGISSPGSNKQVTELTLHKKKGIRFFSPVELEQQEKMARQRKKVDENVDEEFEVFKNLADLNFETETVKDRYTLKKFLGRRW